MSIVLGILCLILCCFGGYLISSKFKERVCFYLDFKNFNEIIKKEVSFSKKTINEILLLNKNEFSVFYYCINNKIINNLYIKND